LSADDKDKEREGAAKKEMQVLKGTWQLESVTLPGGEVVPEGKFKPELTIQDGKYSLTDGKGETSAEGKVVIDVTKKPKESSLTPAKAKPWAGLFELAGDEPRICYGAPGGPRPKSMTREDGKQQSLLTYKRLKP
jgi:uncharacterized protein (TIGR03067 family)